MVSCVASSSRLRAAAEARWAACPRVPSCVQSSVGDEFMHMKHGIDIETLGKRPILWACILLSFLVYVMFAVAIMLCTWTIAVGDDGAGAVFGAMLFFYVPSVAAPYVFGVVIDSNRGVYWLIGAALAMVVGLYAALVTFGSTYLFICMTLIATSFYRELSNIMVRKRLASWAGRRCLVKLNGWETTARRLGYLCGSALGGGLLTLVTIEAGFSLLIALALAVVLLLRYVASCAGEVARHGRLRSSFTRVYEQFSGTWLWLWVGIFIIHCVAAEVLSAALAVFVVTSISERPLDMSLISNAHMIGALVGGVVLSRVVTPARPIRALATYMLCLAATIYLFSLATTVMAAVIGFFCVGLFFQGRILCQALIQAECSAAHQAKLQSVVSVGSGIATMVSLALLSQFSAVITPSHYFVAIVAMLLFAFLVCFAAVAGSKPIPGQLQSVG